MIIGSRGSELALVQARTVAAALERQIGVTPEVRIIRTQGDRVTDRPLRELEGSGYFTKELEEALLNQSIDVAVHSFKDMPSRAPDGLVVAAVSAREDPADLIIIRVAAYDSAAGTIPVRSAAVVGTSAVRREAQLRALRPDLELRDLRGNVPTRIEKLDRGDYDAILLAAAGVRRLGLDLRRFKVVRLEPDRFVPAPGQGALAIQVRVAEPRLPVIRAALHDDQTSAATAIERDVQRRFGGGCGLPLGAHARFNGGGWQALGFWSEQDKPPVWSAVDGDDPAALGEQLYRKLVQASA